MIRPILKYGDSVLHERARNVDEITPDVDRLVEDLIETMYAAPGIGLAAPQVGIALRMFVIDLSVGRDLAGLIVLINPEFVERDGMQLEEEGCLSVPGFNATVVRPSRVVVKGLDRSGQHISDAPVKARANAAGVPLLQPERLKDARFMAELAALHADLGVVAAYGKILTDEVLAQPPLGLINVHASLLPKYRGAAPVHRAMIAGERETGVTIMRVVKALDAGPMLASARRPIGPEETSEAVERDLARQGAALLVSTTDALAQGL